LSKAPFKKLTLMMAKKGSGGNWSRDVASGGAQTLHAGINR